ncbi:MAG: PEP-CTERM system TPR-repeat protein PrsT [Burkholderiaceae bacterium]|nr:PEP-CTERM system TPR-repeat protein PrsT [Burkholderiaceae bacterium]
MPYRLIVPLIAPLTTLLLATALSGCSELDKDAGVAKARQHRAKGELRAATIEFKNVLQQYPDDGETRYLLAQTYNETGEALTAEKEIRRAINLGYENDAALAELAKALLLQGEYQKALDQTAKAVKPGPALLCLRADALRALGKSDEAKALYDAALLAQPTLPAALLGLGRLAQTAGDIAAASKYVAQARTAEPRNTDALLFAADLLRSQKKYDDAMAALDQILAIAPEHRSAHIEKAYILIPQAKFTAAQAELKAATASGPTGMMVLYTQALLDFTQGKDAAALDSLQKVLRAAPEHAPSMLMAGAINMNMGSLSQAEYYLRNYLRLNPGNLYARKLLTSTLLKAGQAPDAMAVLEPALNTSAQDAEILALAGESFMQSRDFNKAGELFSKAAAISPNTAGLRTAMGLSKLGQGNSEAALADLQEAVRSDPGNAQVGIALTTTLLTLNRNEQALTTVQDLEKAQPKNAVIQNMKGMVYAARKELGPARAAFEQALVLQPSYFPAATNLSRLEMELKNPAAAKKHLQDFMANNKGHVDAMTAMAALAARERNLPEVTRWLEKAHNDHPEAIAPGIRLINHYLLLRETGKAAALAGALQAKNPDNTDLLDMLGKSHIADKNLELAVDAYKKLAIAMPRSPQVHMQVAALYVQLNNVGAAEDHLKAALAMQPDFPAAQLAQAEIYVKRGAFDLALMISDQLQKAYPKSSGGFQLEGDILMARKKPALAVPQFERALAISPTDELLIKTANALRASGKTAEGAARIEQWLKQHPDDVRVLQYKGETLLADKQYQAAASYLQGLVQRYPSNITAVNNLAWAYQQLDDPRAVAAAEQAYKLAPQHPVVMDTLGWALVQQGQAARGLSLLQKASAAAPEARDIRFHLAQAKAKTGDKPGARKELEMVLSGPIPFAQAEEAKALLKQLL